MENPFHGPWTYFSLFTFWNIIAKIHKNFICLTEECLPFFKQGLFKLQTNQADSMMGLFLIQASGQSTIHNCFCALKCASKSLFCYLPSDDKLRATATSSADSGWGRPWHCKKKINTFKASFKRRETPEVQTGHFSPLFSMMPLREFAGCYLVPFSPWFCYLIVSKNF